MANVVSEKRCTHCLQTKTIDSFSKERNTGNVYRSYCKPCAVKRVQKTREGDKNWWRKFHLKRYFDMSLEDFNKMLDAQDYKCAVCFSLFDTALVAKKPNLDHDHKTGKARAVLCFSCNTALGKMNDNVQTLKNAITYLERYSNE